MKKLKYDVNDKAKIDHTALIHRSYDIQLSILIIRNSLDSLNSLDLISYDEFVFLNSRLDNFLEYYKAVFDVD